MKSLIGTGGDTVWMQPPFYCDYGANMHLGTRVFFNFNCIVLDVCEVHIGDYTLFGPGVQILTPLHPFDGQLRREREFGKPITIGSDVWVGGGALILAGVKIGSGTVIGAGRGRHARHSRGRLCGGQSCRVIRAVSELEARSRR